MLLRDYAIVAICFSVIVLGLMGLVGGFEAKYSTEINQSLAWQQSGEDFNATYDAIKEMQARTGNMSENIQAGGLEGAGTAEVLVEGTWDVIVLLFSSFNVFAAMIGDTAMIIGIPFWIAMAALSIIVILVVAAIVGLFTRREA